MLSILDRIGRQAMLPAMRRTIIQNCSSKLNHHNTIMIRNMNNLINSNNSTKILTSSTMVLYRFQNIRMLSFFRRRILRLSPAMQIFVGGFTAMTCFVLLEKVYNDFKLSGLELKDFIMGTKPATEMKFSDDNDKFKTRYAAILEKDEIPEYKVTRSVKGQFRLPGVKLTLFQFMACPFCCKVRTFLDYYGIEYDIVEVNPITRREIKFSKTYRKVPILLVEQESNKNGNNPDDKEYALQINDSTLIISALTSYILSMKSTSRHHNESVFNITRWYLNSQVYKNINDEEVEVVGAQVKADHTTDELVNRYFLMIGDVDPAKFERMDPPLAEERRWRRWVDDHFVHVLSPNIYRTLDEAKRSFNHFSDAAEWQKTMSEFERKIVINIGALAMYFVSKSLKRKYQLDNDVRRSLFDSGKYWTKGLAGRPFLGGQKPNLGDLAVYANFCAIEGCEAFDDAMRTNPTLERWFNNVRNEVQSNAGYNIVKSFN